ncbi:hypothetical protein [Spirobacillus cienkowskii]|uniref:hypothetical protein n=1 Tax=Spirobacillus cienkowskii TaxID=495820 RepID=UPI0030CB2426
MIEEQKIIDEVVELMLDVQVNEDNPQKFILKFNVNDEKKSAKLNFSFIANDEEHSALVGLDAIEKFHCLLMELRELFAKRKPFHYWKSCVFEINFELKNYEFNFVYD